MSSAEQVGDTNDAVPCASKSLTLYLSSGAVDCQGLAPERCPKRANSKDVWSIYSSNEIQSRAFRGNPAQDPWDEEGGGGRQGSVK